MISLQVKQYKVEVEPFIPNEKHLDFIRSKLISKLYAKLSEKEQLLLNRYINELSAGRYYNVQGVAREMGAVRDRVSTIWRTLIATGIIKRAEFAQMKPGLVHESELPTLVKVLEEFNGLGRGWSATVQLTKESLQRAAAETANAANNGIVNTTADTTVVAEAETVG